MLGVAMIMLLSSFSLKNLLGGKSSTPASETTVTTPSDGQAAGAALKALYAQYKADGKFDAGNINNIMNTVSLINSCKNLKSSIKDGEYWKSFCSGLILGSDNLVTENIADNVTTQLSTLIENVDTSKLESASNNTLAAAQTVGQSANAISNILALFK